MDISAVGEAMEVRVSTNEAKTLFNGLPHQVVDLHGVINIDAEDVGNPQLVSLVNIDISWHGKDD